MSVIGDLRKEFGRALVSWGSKYYKIGRLSVSPFSTTDGEPTPNNVDAFLKTFRTNVWVYCAVYAISSAAAGVPLRVMRKLGDGSADEVVDHQFAKLLRNPNEFMTGYDLIELCMIFLEATGNNYFLLDNGKPEGLKPGESLKLSQVKEIWPLPPGDMSVVPDSKEFIKQYLYRPAIGGKILRLQVPEVLHLKYAAPLSPYYGQGAVEPARNAIAGDQYAEGYNNAAFKNGGIPAGFLETEEVLTAEQKAEYRAMWASMFEGVQNQHKVGFLDGGMKFAVPETKPKDMAYEEFADRMMRKIIASMGVPMLFTGSDGAKYDNAEQQLRFFWECTMTPKFKKIGAMLTKKLHALGEPEDLFVEFDTSKVPALQQNFKGMVEAAKGWSELGVPLNDLIPLFGPSGMAPVVGGDTGFVSSSVIPIEEAGMGHASGIGPEGGAEDAPAEDVPGTDPEADPNLDPASKKTKAADPHKRMDDIHWKRFIVTQEPEFRRFRAELRKLFSGQRRRILAKIAEHYKRDTSAEVFLFNVNEEAKGFAAKTKKIIEATMKRFGVQAIADVGGSIDFKISNPRAVQFIERRAFKFAEEVNKTTQNRLRGIFSDAFANGSTQGDLVKAITTEFDFYERTRAARIARTETGIAANGGIQEGLTQAGIETKRWISSRDGQVRPSHEAVDGDEVKVSDPFEVAGTMMMNPGDPSAPVEEVANCRCTMRGVVS